MEISQTYKQIACEIMCCRNKAKYVLKSDKSLFNNTIFICENCLTEMHNLFSKIVVPKSIKNIYKKGDTNEKRS